jgi:hypothetical protein
MYTAVQQVYCYLLCYKIKECRRNGAFRCVVFTWGFIRFCEAVQTIWWKSVFPSKIWWCSNSQAQSTKTVQFQQSQINNNIFRPIHYQNIMCAHSCMSWCTVQMCPHLCTYVHPRIYVTVTAVNSYLKLTTATFLIYKPAVKLLLAKASSKFPLS